MKSHSGLNPLILSGYSTAQTILCQLHFATPLVSTPFHKSEVGSGEVDPQNSSHVILGEAYRITQTVGHSKSTYSETPET